MDIFTSRYLRSTTLAVTITAIGVLSSCTRTPAEKEARFLKRGETLALKHDNARAILEFRSASQAMPYDAEPYYRAALVYLSMNDPKSAVAYLQKALQLNPSHSGSQIELAKLKIRTSNKGLIEDAEKSMRTLASKSDSASALNVLALSEVRLGKLPEAEHDLASALAKDPHSISSAESLAALKMYEKDPGGAEAVLKTSVHNNPNSSSAALSLADFYAKTGRRSLAMSELQRSLHLDPNNTKALLQLAILQARSGQSAEAESSYKKLATYNDPELKPLHAVFVYQQGNRKSGVAELHQLVAQYPDNRNFRNLLVSAELGNNQIQDAEQSLAAALKRNPKDVDALLQRSKLFLNSGRLEQTEADLRTVLSYEPNSADAHFGLAQVAARRGSVLLERQELNDTLRLKPDLLAARIELSSLMLRSKDAKLAVQILKDAPAGQKNGVDYTVALNNAMLAADEVQGVRRSLDEALARSRAPQLLLQDADLKFKQHDYAGARKPLEELLNTYPENMPALNLLARTYVAQDLPDRALETLQQYAARNPTSPYVLSVLGSWQLRTQHPAAARQAFLDAIKLAPDAIPPRLALAHLDTETGSYNEAALSLEAILRREPGNTQALLQAGVLEERKGNSSAARERYRAVLSAEPANIQALTRLAYILTGEDQDQALRYAQNAVEQAPEDPAAQDVLGWVYYKRGLSDSALPHFKAAVAVQPTAIHRYHLALAYAGLGDSKLAQDNLSAALRMDPKLRISEPLQNVSR